jgi:hypothetical protein
MDQDHQVQGQVKMLVEVEVQEEQTAAILDQIMQV